MLLEVKHGGAFAEVVRLLVQRERRVKKKGSVPSTRPAILKFKLLVETRKGWAVEDF